MIKKRLTQLMGVKSIVTLTLTVAFCVLSLQRVISAQEFMTVFTMVISFYFGTQYARKNEDQQ